MLSVVVDELVDLVVVNIANCRRVVEELYSMLWGYWLFLPVGIYFDFEAGHDLHEHSSDTLQDQIVDGFKNLPRLAMEGRNAS